MMPKWLRFKIMMDVMLGIAKLHRQLPKPIVHHDIKPENILISEDYVGKVSDFGTATGLRDTLTTMGTKTEAHGVGGSSQYMAPEALDVNKTTMDLPSVGNMMTVADCIVQSLKLQWT